MLYNLILDDKISLAQVDISLEEEISNSAEFIDFEQIITLFPDPLMGSDPNNFLNIPLGFLFNFLPTLLISSNFFFFSGSYLWCLKWRLPSFLRRFLLLSMSIP